MRLLIPELYLSLLLCAACTSAEKKVPDQAQKLSAPDSGQVTLPTPWNETDTLDAIAPVLILFYPDEAEIKALAEQSADKTLMEAQADFEFYSQVLLNKLQQQGDQAFLTHARFIRIQQANGSLHLIDRRTKPVMYGVIMSNGKQEPYTEWGLLSNEVLLEKWNTCKAGHSPDPSYRNI